MKSDREESNTLRQNMAKNSKGKLPQDLNQISRANKKSRKIKKNNDNIDEFTFFNLL